MSILVYIFNNIFASRFVYDGLKSPRPHNVFHIFWIILVTAFLLKAFSSKPDIQLKQTRFLTLDAVDAFKHCSLDTVLGVEDF